MKRLDKLIRALRVQKIAPYVQPNSALLDIGCHDGYTFSRLGSHISSGVGIEPLAVQPLPALDSRFIFIQGMFPQAASAIENEKFDAISMLAVIEHIPQTSMPAVVDECYRLLKPGGRVLITAPSPAVDYVLAGLRFLRLIDGMSLEEHYGFNPQELPAIFDSSRFSLLARKRFQFGLNNFFAFEKRAMFGNG